MKNSAVHVTCHKRLEEKSIPLAKLITAKNNGEWSPGQPLDGLMGEGQNSQNQSKGQGQNDQPQNKMNDFDFKLEPEGEAKPQDSNSITREELSKFLREAQQTIDKNASRAMSRLTLTNKEIEEKLQKAASEQMEAAVKKFAARTIEVQQPNQEPVKIEGAHKNLAELIEVISIKPREHAYAWGPPGSGKSTGAMHAAKALSMDYAYISLNPQTPESRLLGFIDANGVYRPTPFRRIYEFGGVFCIDELDNASPSLLTTLNGCLENGTAAFPDTMVQAHEDFVVVATGNTSGRGGDQFFPERRPFDAAFAERFSFIYWDYDEQLERQIALAFNPNADSWVDWVQKVRNFCRENIIRLTVSPRASIKGAKQTALREVAPLELAERVLFKGLHKDDKNKILSHCGQPPTIKQVTA